MIVVAAAVLAAILPAEPLQAADCDATAMLRERAELILPELDEAKQAAATAVESGAGATETLDTLAAAYWSELLALEKSPEWRAWRVRWIECAVGTDGMPQATGRHLPADAGGTDDHALTVCGLAVSGLASHVRAARGSGVDRESAKATIELMVPEEAPESLLSRI